MTFVWVILGVIGAIVLFLVLNDEGGTVFGLQNSKFAEVALLSMWCALIAAAIIPRQGSLKIAARNAVIWLLIILALLAGYVFRHDLQDVASRLTGGLVPGSPVSIQTTDGVDQIELSPSVDGHFVARMDLNGRTTSLLVDTGASMIVLTNPDARRIGIDTDGLSYTAIVSTANGRTTAARTSIQSVKIGNIARRDVNAMVAQPGALEQSLLGMNFLGSLSAFEFRGDRLYLTD